jgi:hypothetical protein
MIGKNQRYKKGYLLELTLFVDIRVLKITLLLI